jgi:competence protein ComEC
MLLAYVMLIGAPASAVRAFIMLFFHRAGQVWGRPARGLPALAASAVAVLIWEPRQLFDVGARLSYGIVAGILLYGIPLGELLRERMPLYQYLPPGDLRRWQRAAIAARDWFCGSLGVCLGAFLIGAPLSMQYFGVFAPGSMLLNLLLVPVALICVGAATLSGGLFTIGLVLHMDWPCAMGSFVNHAGWLCAWLMHGAMEGSVRVPLLFWKCGFPAPWTGSFVALTLLGLCVLLRSPSLARRPGWQMVPLATLLAVALAAAAVS